MHGDKHRKRRGTAAGIWLIVVLALVLTPAGPIAGSDKKAWSPTPLTGEAGDLPKGRDVVKRAIDFVQTHDRLGFEALATYEVLQEDGQKLQFDMLQRVAFERSRRLYWVTLHDNGNTETAWCKDGTFTMVKQPANVWGRVNVPPALTDAVSRVANDYNVPVPFVDLFSGDAAELWLGEDVEWVHYIAEAWTDGQWTDHVAVRRPEVDVQLWFRQGDEPFLVKMAIVRTEAAGSGATNQAADFSSSGVVSALPKVVPAMTERQTL